MEDGDIDLDLGLEDGDQHVGDDDLSLQDAGTDGGIDLQAGFEDQDDYDDYMVDKEDIIEEDEIDYGDLELEDAGQDSAGSPVATHDAAAAQANLSVASNRTPNAGQDAGVEEDLIDYSDDDDDPAHTLADAVTEAQDAPTHLGADSVNNNTTGGAQGDIDPPGPDGRDTGLESHIENAGEEYEISRDVGGDLDGEEQTPAGAVDDTYDQQHGQLAGEDINGDPDHRTEHENDAGETVESDQGRRFGDTEQVQTETEAPQDSASQGLPLHPVTVNYDGTELWLFKPQDPEDDEWLLSDESIATQPFPYLFHACRAQLGDDVNSETELGLRFDNFHALELFEDCTACAYSTLKEFLDIYIALHAQDGNGNPEPFYITLQFRPRVLTLVNELKKAVQDKIGFSGLNNAVAAGQTSFNVNTFADELSSGEEHWEEGEDSEDHQEQSLEESRTELETQSNEKPKDTDVSRPADQTNETDDAGFQGDQDNGGSPTVADKAIHDHVKNPENVPSTGASNVTVEHSPVLGSTIAQEAPVPEPNDGGNASIKAHHEEQGLPEDFIDYSDDEDEEDTAKSGVISVREVSSTSSTVRGDDPSYPDHGAEEFTNQTGYHDDDNGDGRPAQEYGETGQAEVDLQNHADPEYDEIADYGNDQEFDQAYEQGFQSGEYSAQTFGQGDDEYYYGDDGNTDFNDPSNDVAVVEEANDIDSSNTYQEVADNNEEENPNDMGDLLNLTGAEGENRAGDKSVMPEDGFDEDVINFDDDEDVAEEATVDGSATAPPVVASSTRVDGLGSPQGQKRPLDEVDGGLDGAGDLTGSYALDVRRYCSYADYIYADAKRTKL
jgi:hypothetical protein